MAHDHDHDHDHHHHDHEHSELSETQLRVRALETVLTEKGYVDPAALDAIVEAYETKIGPRNGARVVAKAWTDPAFKKELLDDATKAINALGHIARTGDHLIAVENTPQRHNMVVCTLCSCYPWEMLGLPPVWYKASPYRSRAVKDPRGVLRDFGVTLSADTEIRVWDSTAETRFLVLPMRPARSAPMAASISTRSASPASRCHRMSISPALITRSGFWPLKIRWRRAESSAATRSMPAIRCGKARR